MHAEEKITKLENELKESTGMVLLAMTNSSELGWVIEFLKQAFIAPNLDDLAHRLLKHLQSIGLNSSIWFASADKPHCMNMDEDDDQIDMLFIQRHRNDGRMLANGNSLLINFEHVSLLVDNMPEEEERRGRLNDSLMTLLEGVESRVKGLVSEQKASLARKARDEFYSIMSHELRTPLNPIIGFSKLLSKKLESKVTPKEFKTLQSILDNGQRLLALINNLLDLSSIEHGAMTLHRQIFRVDERIKAILALTATDAKNSKTTVKLETDIELDFFGDSEKFFQIVLNIVSNAIKFSPAASVSVNYALTEEEPYGNCLVVIVADTGPGIKKTDQNSIFEQFAMADGSHTRTKGGTGIGLYIAKKLVEMHGGRIDLDSEEGKGSSFKMIFPAIH